MRLYEVPAMKWLCSIELLFSDAHEENDTIRKGEELKTKKNMHTKNNWIGILSDDESFSDSNFLLMYQYIHQQKNKFYMRNRSISYTREKNYAPLYTCSNNLSNLFSLSVLIFTSFIYIGLSEKTLSIMSSFPRCIVHRRERRYTFVSIFKKNRPTKRNVFLLSRVILEVNLMKYWMCFV